MIDTRWADDRLFVSVTTENGGFTFALPGTMSVGAIENYINELREMYGA